MGKSRRPEGPAPDAGSSPFRALDRVIRDAGIRLRAPEPRAPEPRGPEHRGSEPRRPEPAPPAPSPAAPAAASPPAVNEETLFDEAMRGVVTRKWRRPVPRESPPDPPAPEPDESGDLKLFEEAIDGDPPPFPLDHPEYIEGWIGVQGRLVLPSLRSGLFSIQGQLDLHGLDRIEAQDAVTDFVFRMARFRSCCVKIIHGRGINSPGETAVLKENLQRWLSSRRLARYVVAYASAPVRDGGVGAVYVLLSKERRTRA